MNLLHVEVVCVNAMDLYVLHTHPFDVIRVLPGGISGSVPKSRRDNIDIQINKTGSSPHSRHVLVSESDQ